ncbi:MAG: Crp/Fnr family transcriptional regulator [Sphaerobacter sp.]|nr:Crp/Fnr family transcriptional regulator [Sphaerobacter sp.]
MDPTDAARPQRWDLARRAAYLSSVRLFRELPASTVTEIARRAQPRSLRDGEFVFLAGQSAESVSLLVEGRIKVIRETEDGREVILRLIQPGEIFGGAGIWYEPVYPASAVAIGPGVILRMSTADWIALLRDEPEVALALLRELAARLREAEARIAELQTERAERRIARALLRLASKTGVPTEAGVEIGLPLSRQDLAEFTGTTLSTASRTLSAWDRAGLIQAGRERVVLLQPQALRALAADAPQLEGARE